MPQFSASIFTPVPEYEARCNAKIQDFTDFIQITCFSSDIFLRDGYELKTEPKQQNYVSDEKREYKKSDISRDDNVKRARKKAYEIAYANEFEYFVTFTLSSDHINRYDANEIQKKFRNWLNHKAQRNNLIYLIFPEYHQDGAIHFHGLISGKLSYTKSGHYTKNGQEILNLDDWTLGFTSAVKLEGERGKIVNYVMKYITKESARVFSSHYYAGGNGLKRTVPTVYEKIDFCEFEGKYYKVPNAPLGVKYLTIPKDGLTL